MHRLLSLAFLVLLATNAGAEVLRCIDAAGKVSYTDGSCPTGTKPERSVSTREPVQVLPDASGRKPTPPVDAPATRPSQPPPPAQQQSQKQPAGAVIIDGHGSDPLVVDEGYGYPYPYAGVYQRSHRPPRDMHPRIVGCDVTGCRDTQGNVYNRNTGQLDRYKSIDGKNCHPVGSTTVCR